MECEIPREVATATVDSNKDKDPGKVKTIIETIISKKNKKQKTINSKQ